MADTTYGKRYILRRNEKGLLMRLKVNNVRVSLLEETSVKEAAAKKLGLKKQDIENCNSTRQLMPAVKIIFP